MADEKTIIADVQVFDGTAFVGPKHVAFQHGEILSVSDTIPEDDPNEAKRIIDGRGKFLVPGYTDCHVHIRFKNELLVHAHHGVSTVLDMGCWPIDLANSFRNLKGYPDYLTAGPVAVHPHGLHSHAPGETGLPEDCTVDTEDKAVQFVKNRLADKTDFIKIVCEDSCPVEPAKKIASEAKAAGKISISHAPSIETFHNALQVGANIITHAPMDGIIDDNFCQQVLNNGQIAVPTLIMMKIGIKKFKTPYMMAGMVFLSIKAMVSAGKGMRDIFNELTPKIKSGLDFNYSLESVRKMHAAGIPICTGTDSNVRPASGGPVTVPHGSSFHKELELLEEAGLSRLEILRAATSEPAKHFRLLDRGSIEVGKRADLVLLEKDPLLDIKNFAAIDMVWCKGQRILLPGPTRVSGETLVRRKVE